MSSIELQARQVTSIKLGPHRYTPGALKPGDGYAEIEVATVRGDRIVLVLFVNDYDIASVASDLRTVAEALERDRQRALFEAPIRERMDQAEAAAVAKLNGGAQ